MPRRESPREFSVKRASISASPCELIARRYRSDGWNHLVLFAGDGDFVELVQELVEHRNVSLTLVGDDRSTSLELRSYATRMIVLAELATELAMPSIDETSRGKTVQFAPHHRLDAAPFNGRPIGARK